LIWAICKNTWNQCLASRVRLGILCLVWIAPILQNTISLCVQHVFPEALYSQSNSVALLVLIVGSGCIGSQLNDGTLSLTLSRPLTVAQYVMSKWFAVFVASSVAALSQLAAEVLVSLTRTPALINPADVLTNGAERVILCVGLSAVLILLSSLVSGVKDLAFFLVLSMVASLCVGIGQLKVDDVPAGWPQLAVSVLCPVCYHIGQAGNFILGPMVDLSSLANIPWSVVASYFAVIATFLSLAIFSLNRRELPYGAE